MKITIAGISSEAARLAILLKSKLEATVSCASSIEHALAEKPDLIVADKGGPSKLDLNQLVSCPYPPFAVFNCEDPSHIVLPNAFAITSSSRQAVYALLDRSLRAVELPADENTAAEIHAAIIAAQIARMKDAGRDKLVSFVIPVFNPPPEFFRETVLSIVEQDDPGWELVLLDNGDPAATAPVLSDFNDPRIRYFSGWGPRGIAMGRNLGNLLARGKIIAVMDHDDVCAPGRARAIKALLGADNKIFYSDVRELFPDGRVAEKKSKLFTAADLRHECNIFHPSVAYPFDLAAKVPYDPRFEPADDYHFYLAAVRAGAGLVHAAEPLLHYRRHYRQFSRVAEKKMDAVTIAVHADDQYLRAGGNPLDREKRYEPLAVSLLAMGRDDEASGLIESGYGPQWLRDDSQENPRARAWIKISRGENGEAETILRQGIEKGKLEARERMDLADLLYRRGAVDEARKFSNREAPLGAIVTRLWEEFYRRSNGEPPFPVRIQPGPGEAEEVSIIIAGASREDGLAGLESSRGKFIALLRPGDRLDPEYHARAVKTLHQVPEADAVMGRVRSDGNLLPDRVIPVSALLRDERALLMGMVIRREALGRIGGFIPALGEARDWELTLRAFSRLNVIQTEAVAGESGRGPALDRSRRANSAEDFTSALLVKLLHSPLRHLDLAFSGKPAEFVEERLRVIARLSAREELLPHLDPREFLAEYNDPAHLLYRLGQRLAGASARAAFAESLRLKPFEPKAALGFLASYF